MLTRKLVVQSLRTLPKKFPMADLVDRIALAEKIEAGITKCCQENSFPTEEARKRLISNLRFTRVE